MPVISNSFDLQSVEWRRVTDPGNKDFKVDFEYSLLGYDLPSGRLDMLLRYGKQGGHCRRHRHVAATVTLVLEGDYALAPADALPHDEHGGENGGTVLLSLTAKDGVLFEYFDENMERQGSVSIEEYVTSWNDGTIYGKFSGADALAAD